MLILDDWELALKCLFVCVLMCDCGILDGKYVVLPSGELQIRNVTADDGFKTYKCRTKHRLTGETKLSATAGKLVITGKPM